MAARKSSRSGAKPASANRKTRSKAAGREVASRKTPSGKSSGRKKASTRKSTAKKAGAKKATAKKTAGKKAAAKPASRRKASARKARGRRSAGAPDRVAEIQRVIDVMVDAGAVEVELEEAGSKLRVRLKEEHPAPVVGYAPPAPPASSAATVPGGGAVAGEAAGAADDGRQQVLTAPMVGTFYRSPSPDSDPFVQVGDQVTPDSTLYILEAMKVMNEIKAELEGRVAKILVQNGEPVEYGQPLMVLEVD